MFIDKREEIAEFVLTHTELGAEIAIWGKDLSECMSFLEDLTFEFLGDFTFEDIDNISYIEYEEGSNHCVVVF